MESENSTDLSFKVFLKNFTTEAFHIDGRIIRTTCALIVKPGYLTLAYFNNSTKKYIQPLKLYFAINLLFFLLIPLLTTSQFKVFNISMKSLTGSNQIYQEMIKNQIQAKDVSEVIYEERFNAHLKYNQPALVFIIIPFFALVLKIVNFKSKRYYVEHLFFSIHFLSTFLLFLLIIISLYRFLTFGLKFFSISIGVVALIILAIFVILLAIYLMVAIKKYYKNRTLLSTFKSIILLTSFLLIFGGYTQFLFFYTILALKWGY